MKRIKGGRMSNESENGTTEARRLLVEDQANLRVSLALVLRDFGYQVLEAGSADEAMRLVRAHAGPIHLLVSDVVMPQTSGPALATRHDRQSSRRAGIRRCGARCPATRGGGTGGVAAGGGAVWRVIVSHNRSVA